MGSTENPLHFGKNFRKNVRLSFIADPNEKNLGNDTVPGLGYMNPSYLWKISKTNKLIYRKHSKTMGIAPTSDDHHNTT